MGIISSIAGLGMQAAGSIIGAIQGKKAYDAINSSVNKQLSANEDWYNRRYNEDATQKADAQRLLTQTEQSILNRNKQAAGAAAVMGGTEESVAAQKAAGNQALADAVSQINANAEAQKSAIEQQYMAKNDALQGQLQQMQANKAANVAQAVSGIADAAGSVMSSGALDGIFGKKKA